MLVCPRISERVLRSIPDSTARVNFEEPVQNLVEGSRLGTQFDGQLILRTHFQELGHVGVLIIVMLFNVLLHKVIVQTGIGIGILALGGDDLHREAGVILLGSGQGDVLIGTVAGTAFSKVLLISMVRFARLILMFRAAAVLAAVFSLMGFIVVTSFFLGSWPCCFALGFVPLGVAI